MKALTTLGTALLFLTLGTIVPAFAQDKQEEAKPEQKQEQEHAQPQKQQPQQQEQQAQEQQSPKTCEADGPTVRSRIMYAFIHSILQDSGMYMHIHRNIIYIHIYIYIYICVYI